MDKSAVSGIGKRRDAARREGNAEYAAKRKELIRAAAKVFRDKGYAGATLNDVAVEFGTDRASLYYYVASKEDLFQACITDIVMLNAQRAEAIAAGDTSPRGKLQELIAMLIESQVEHWPYMYVYMQEDMVRVSSVEAEWAQQMVNNTRKIEKSFLDVITEGVETGELRSDIPKTLMANSLFGMTQWTYRWYVPGKSRFNPGDLIQAFSNVFFEGILET